MKHLQKKKLNGDLGREEVKIMNGQSYPMESNLVSKPSLEATIVDLSNVISEIKSRVFTPIPSGETLNKNPMSEYKLENINVALVTLIDELRGILRAVSSL